MRAKMRAVLAGLVFVAIATVAVFWQDGAIRKAVSLQSNNASAVIGMSTLGTAQRERRQSDMADAPGQTRLLSEQRFYTAQQEMGTTCETPDGTVCPVDPQPISSICRCGSTIGKVTR